jgi:hypothetical protein
LEANSDNKDNMVRLQSAAESRGAIDKKLDELIALLTESEFDGETIKQYQYKISAAFKDKTIVDDLKAFEVIDGLTGASKEQLLDEFSVLLETHTFNSKATTKFLKIERTNKLILMIIGAIMIMLGFAMIIMPAPPYFEMFTIFYFSRDNGVTLMDLISLIIVFAGVYVFVRPLYKKTPTR